MWLSRVRLAQTWSQHPWDWVTSKSKRVKVQLLSSAQTGYFYLTDKSPLKKDYRLALRKHDPIVNRHVMFYEASVPTAPHLINPKNTNIQKGNVIGIKRKVALYDWARWTGKVNSHLTERIKRRAEKYGNNLSSGGS